MELLGQESIKVHATYTHADWQHILAETPGDAIRDCDSNQTVVFPMSESIHPGSLLKPEASKPQN